MKKILTLLSFFITVNSFGQGKNLSVKIQGGGTAGGSITNKLNISDTASMLQPYLEKAGLQPGPNTSISGSGSHSDPYIISSSGIGGGSVATVLQTITSDSVITLTDSTTWLIVNPSSTLSSLTVTLPANPSANQKIDISFGGNINTTGASVVLSLLIVANTGQSLVGTGTYGEAVTEDHIAYKYNFSLSKWFRQ